MKLSPQLENTVADFMDDAGANTFWLVVLVVVVGLPLWSIFA